MPEHVPDSEMNLSDQDRAPRLGFYAQHTDKALPETHPAPADVFAGKHPPGG